MSKTVRGGIAGALKRQYLQARKYTQGCLRDEKVIWEAKRLLSFQYERRSQLAACR